MIGSSRVAAFLGVSTGRYERGWVGIEFRHVGQWVADDASLDTESLGKFCLDRADFLRDGLVGFLRFEEHRDRVADARRRGLSIGRQNIAINRERSRREIGIESVLRIDSRCGRSREVRNDRERRRTKKKIRDKRSNSRLGTT